ncbi:MAG: tetratricopeptide repeat protein [Candidatus Ozemobacteraceae bacterium]
MSDNDWLNHFRQERLRQSGRNPGLAALMSFFVMGLGQVYAGHVDRGIMLVFVHLGGLISGYSIFSRGMLYETLAGYLSPMGLLATFYVGAASLILLWIYNIKEAYYLSLFAGFRDWFEVERVLLPGGGEDSAPRLLSFGSPALPRMEDIKEKLSNAAALDSRVIHDAVPIVDEPPSKINSQGNRTVFPTDVLQGTSAGKHPSHETASSPQGARSPSPGRSEKVDGCNISVEPTTVSIVTEGENLRGTGGNEHEFISLGTGKKRTEFASKEDGKRLGTSPGRKSRRGRDLDLLLEEAMKLKRAMTIAFAVGICLLVAGFYGISGGREYLTSKKRTSPSEELFTVGGEFTSRVIPASPTVLYSSSVEKQSPASEAERLEAITRSGGESSRDVWIALLRVLRELDVPDRHEDALRRYLEAFPRDVERWVELGKRQYDRRAFVEASRSLTTGLVIQPRHSRANYLLGAIYRELGMPDEAVPCLQKALTTDPLNPEFNLELGAAYFDGHDVRLARKYIEKTLSVESQNEAAQKLLKQLEESAGAFPISGDNNPTSPMSPFVNGANAPEMGVGPMYADGAGVLKGRQALPSRLDDGTRTRVSSNAPGNPLPSTGLPNPNVPLSVVRLESPPPLVVPAPMGSFQDSFTKAKNYNDGESGRSGVTLYAAPGFENRTPAGGAAPSAPPILLDALLPAQDPLVIAQSASGKTSQATTFPIVEKSSETKEKATEIKEKLPQTKEMSPEIKEKLPQTEEMTPKIKEKLPQTKEVSP